MPVLKPTTSVVARALALVLIFAGGISADLRFGLQVSVEAHGGGGLGVRPGARVVASVDHVSVNGPGSSRTP